MVKRKWHRDLVSEKDVLAIDPEGSTVSCSHYHSRSVHFRQGCLIHHTSRTDQCQAVSPYWNTHQTHIKHTSSSTQDNCSHQVYSSSVLPMFFFKSFIVSGLTFRSLIHFEFIFVNGVRKCSNFILLHIAVQFSQHHWLKKLSLPHCIFFP